MRCVASPLQLALQAGFLHIRHCSHDLLHEPWFLISTGILDISTEFSAWFFFMVKILFTFNLAALQVLLVECANTKVNLRVLSLI